MKRTNDGSNNRKNIYGILKANIPQPGSAANVTSSGLFLLPGATGTGKSHGVCQYIARHAQEWKEQECKIFFTTRMLKNIPDTHSHAHKKSDLSSIEQINQDEDDPDFFSTTTLRRAYKEAKREKEYEKEVLVLRGMHTHLSESWEGLRARIDIGVAQIAEEAEKSDLLQIYEQYKQEVDFFIRYGNDNKFNEADSFYTAQHRFLAELHHILEQKLPETKGRTHEDVIKEREKLIFTKGSPWGWIPDLWPDHRVSRATVILLSLRKFSLPLISVLERTGPVKDSLSEGSLVFIDEFDDAKSAFLDFILEDSLRHKVDLAELARTLGNMVMQNTFLPPSFLTHASGDKEKTEKWIEEKTTQFEKLRNEYGKVSKYYHLEANPKLRRTANEKNNSVFLCRSWQPYIWSGKGTEKIINYAKDDQVNWIEDAKHGATPDTPATPDSKTANRKDSAKKDIKKFVQDLLWFINHFLQLCNDIVMNKKYWLNTIRKKSTKEDIMVNWNLEDYISSVVNHFVPSNATIGDYLQYQLASHQYADPQWKIHPNWFEGDSFFTSGFTEFFLVDSPKNEARTAINMISLSAIPELWLGNLAKRAFVVGLSATAYVDQPITNFVLGYLHNTLGPQFKTISKDDMNILRDLYESSVKGYKHITFLPENSALEYYDEAIQKETIQRWASWLNDTAMAELVRNSIGRSCKTDNQDNLKYIIRRYDLIFQAMKYFNNAKKMRIMYCITPNLFGEEKTYPLEPLTIFKDGLLASSGQVSGWNLVSMDSDNYLSLLETIKNGLKQGKRYFVTTSYATIGRGVNLQYHFADAFASDIVSVHEHPRKDETEVDIDGICLIKPTNVIVSNSGPFFSEKNTFQRLVQIHYLAASGYLTDQEFKDCIVKTMLGQPFSLEGTSASEAIDRAIASIVLQSLGRMTRTGKRMPEIHILCDPEIPELLKQIDLPEEVIKTKEYLHICGNTENTRKSYEKEERIVESQTLSLQRILKIITANFDNPRNREDWERLRPYLLEHPKCNYMNEVEYQRCYCEIPGGKDRYYFKAENDFESCHVAFNQAPETGWSEVSEESSGLPKLMNIAGLADFFKQRGYATSWGSGAVCMNPVAFTSIYLGALGEAAAEFFFSTALGITLKKVEEEHFELFDFKFTNAQQEVCYVDAKFWKVGPGLSDETEQEWIAEKLRQCGGRWAIIINFYPIDTVPEYSRLPSQPELVIIPAVFVNNKIWPDAVKSLKGVLV
jgi:hypothetical protein